MENNEDPYSILGVPRDATTTQIKGAYRKLALRHHPDKIKGTDTEKAAASQKFAKIGAAYEVLSDAGRRREYDDAQRFRGGGFGGGFGGGMRSGVGGRGGAFFEEDLFDGFFGGRRAAPHDGYGGGFGRRPMTDPFELFERVFGEEFGGGHMHGGGGNQRRHDPFDDPFFHDPFFGHGRGAAAGGGFGGGGMMQQMMQHMQMQQMEAMRGHHQHGGFHQNPHHNSANQGFSYSSSSYSSGYGGAARESISTTTKIVNGKRVTVTERTLTRPDGTVERHVERSGDTEDLDRMLPPDVPPNRASLEDGREKKKGRGFFGQKRMSSRRQHRS